MSRETNPKGLLIIIAFLLTILSTAALGRIIYVDDDGPADFNNIQAAINYSSNGDTILVADGTYRGNGNRDIDFNGKSITLKSKNGPENCIIDCKGTEEEGHRGFHFHSGEGQKSIVSGFTIVGGDGPVEFYGGAVFCSAASPTIYNCIIIYNSAGNDGGGIFCSDGSSPMIANNIIVENTAGYKGGGICSSNSSPMITNNTIEGNWGGLYGGGIWCNDSYLTITGNTIARNRAHCGGGLFCLTSSAMITGNRVTENTTDVHAGGMYCRESSPIIIRNNTITGNYGSGIGFVWSTATIMNNTIAGNETGIYCYESSWTITNCILWDNGGDLSGCSVTYSCIKDKSTWEGNIHSDPMFVIPGRWDNAGTPETPWDDFWVDGDYHLKSQAGRWDANEGRWTKDEVTSLCIDAGDPMSPIGLEPFPNGGRINMGAYGGTKEASKSYFGEPVCETIVAGDINGDCKIDYQDLFFLSLNWLADNRPQ